jgi:amino acid transporter
MGIVRAAIAITGALVAALCVALGVLLSITLLDPAEGAGLFGFVVGGLTAAFLIGGGSYLGYAFIRSAVRMKRIKGQDGRNVVRPTLIVFALSLINLLVMPFPLPLRIFMCIGMLVIVVAHLARELEPPRRDPR